MKIKLNEKKIEALIAKVPAKDRVDYWDLTLPGFGLRATKKGARTYVVGGRFGNGNWRRRELGDARIMKFADAKAKARLWLNFAADNKDPAIIEAERAAAEAAKQREAERRQKHTFAAVAADFLSEKVIGPNKNKPFQRKWREVTRHVGILAARWESRPIHSIKRDELVILIKERKSAPAEARNLLGVAKQLFLWARDQAYGLEVNIAADVKPSAIIGEKVSRDRALDTEEIRQLWNAALMLPQPFSAAYQMLILSGLRLNECVRGRREEINYEKKTWTIPAVRMKGKNGSTKPFVVPLTDRMIDILRALPNMSSGYLFTTDNKHPISLGSKIKAKLDVELDFAEPWQNHDLRRSITTGLTELGVKETVCDAILAHRKKGIEATYNKFEYVEPRRAALELWGNHVAPDNVTPLRARA